MWRTIVLDSQEEKLISIKEIREFFTDIYGKIQRIKVF